MYFKNTFTTINVFINLTINTLVNIKKYIFKFIFIIFLLMWLKLSVLFLNNIYIKYDLQWETIIFSNYQYKLYIIPLWLCLVVKNIIYMLYNFFITEHYFNFLHIKCMINSILNTPMNTFITNNKHILLNVENIFIPDSKDYLIFLNKNMGCIFLKFININYFFDITFNKINQYPLFLFFGILFVLSTFASLIFLNYLGLYGAFILNLITISLFWLSMLYYFNLILTKNIFYFINLGKWMQLSNGFQITFDLLIDLTSLSFSFLTLTIGLFVYIYTFSYFRYEPLVERLILFLNSFMISMILLVSSGNFITLFLGWELIGLTSFFLINFWSTRVGTLKSAFKAFSFNKLSDLFLFFAILLIYNTMYNLDILSFNSEIFLYENYTISILNLNISLVELISFFF